MVIELSPDDSVIGCSRGATRLQVYVAGAANGRQRSRCQNVVDAPSPIVPERIAEIVPVSILHAIRVEFSKHIGESPSDRVAVGFAGVNVKVRVIDATVRVLDVDGLRRDVQIAEPDRRQVRVKMLAEIPADAVEPLQLGDVLIGADLEALRNISIHDGNAADDSLHDPNIFAVRTFAQAVEHGFGFTMAESGPRALYPDIPTFPCHALLTKTLRYDALGDCEWPTVAFPMVSLCFLPGPARQVFW